ncbi:MAG: hypothetical protein OXG35_16855, partial [Acidobacteria bacterium]|nr:hypothetical protein [Acidobacteriota bacterium]
ARPPAGSPGPPRPSRSQRLPRAAARIEATVSTDGDRVAPSVIKRILDEEFADEETSWESGDAHEACEIAVTHLLLRYGRLMNTAARTAGDTSLDAFVEAVAKAEPRIRGRSNRHDTLQHYATPLEIAWAMATAADIEAGETVLDPSAGTGTLLAMAHLAQPACRLRACEGDLRRWDLLTHAAPGIQVVQGDTFRLEERMPTWTGHHEVVLLNPPFSRRLGSRGRHRNEDLRHLMAASKASAPGGVIVALLGAGTTPREAAWEKIVDGRLHLMWSTLIDGALMKNREAKITTRLCILRNEEEDDAFDPRTDTERHTEAGTLLDAVRGATGQA